MTDLESKTQEVSEIDKMHPIVVDRLIRGGYLALDDQGNITQESRDKHETFMKDHYFLGQRIPYLAEQSGLNYNSFQTKRAKIK